VFTFKGDAVGFLRSLPDDGALFLRISDRQGEAQNLEFDLGGLRTVREKLAAACKWPSGSLPK
ncbi:MAG TPA: hypothetical protein VGC87_09590, partial [Pyrinomonadaceae bacterium]